VAAAESLEEALLALIESPEYGPGARLPTERRLAEQFNVSRGTVRAALARIEGRGAIVRIMGSGTYVADLDTNAPLLANGRDASPQEIMEARMLIEPRLPALIVAHASSRDLEKIRYALTQSEAVETHDEFEAWDARFHEAMADATHNRLVIDIYRVITTARTLTEWGEMKRRSSTPERRALRQMEHREMFDALIARDAEAARQKIEQHLGKINYELLGF
jgi:DNA-binding FadR family transcriptional regulator